MRQNHSAVLFLTRFSSIYTQLLGEQLGEFPYFRIISWSEKVAFKYLPTDDEIRKVFGEFLYTFC